MSTVNSRPPRKRGTVDSEQVLASAMSIVDGEGVEALTIRRLAAEVGLSPMAIYRHVRDKDELLSQIVDEVARLIGEPAAQGTWQERLTGLLAQARRALLDHPGVALVAITRSSPGPSVALFYDRVLTILDSAGLQPAEAVLAFDALLMFLFGSVLWQSPRQPRERDRLLRIAALLEDPPASLLAHAEYIAPRDADRYFTFGIEAIIRGIDPPAARRPNF